MVKFPVYLNTHDFLMNISVYAIFNDQSFNNTLTSDIVSFEQLGPVLFVWTESVFSGAI